MVAVNRINLEGHKGGFEKNPFIEKFSRRGSLIISRDPLRYDAGDLNLLRFTNNNGLNNLDPMGLEDYDGYVNATSKASASFSLTSRKWGQKTCSTCRADGQPVKSTSLTYTIQLYLSTKITYVEDQNGNDPSLTDHEQKHVDIYNTYGNSSWNVEYTIDKCPEDPSECDAIRAEAWVNLQNKFLHLIEQQNIWDESDAKNISKERINSGTSVNELKKQFEKDFKCGK